MLHLIPAPLHRLALRIGYRLRKRWFELTRRPSGGVSVIAIDGEGRVYLVRHGYGSGRWSLPGGALGRREDPAACARREIREELGCEIDGLELVAQFGEVLHQAPHSAYVYTCRFVGEPKPDGREIVDAGWFARDAVPTELVSFARHRLKRAFPES